MRLHADPHQICKNAVAQCKTRIPIELDLLAVNDIFVEVIFMKAIFSVEMSMIEFITY